MSNEKIKSLEQQIKEYEKQLEAICEEQRKMEKKKEFFDAEVKKYRRILRKDTQSLRFKVRSNFKKVALSQNQEQKNVEESEAEPVGCQNKPKKKKAKNQGKANTFKRKSKKPGRV